LTTSRRIPGIPAAAFLFVLLAVPFAAFGLLRAQEGDEPVVEEAEPVAEEEKPAPGGPAPAPPRAAPDRPAPPQTPAPMKPAPRTPAAPPAPPARPPEPSRAEPLDPASVARRLQEHPDSPVLLNEYGNVLVADGKIAEAARFYRKAVKLAPQLAVAWNNLGVVEAAMGNGMAAESAYRRAIKAAPHYALAWYNLGALHDTLDHYDQAVENYQKAIELDPGLLDARNNPRIASNRHLPAVLVKSYIDRGGSALLPVQSLYPQAVRKDPAKKPRRGER
jgi:tetratricopeptide (TPR) repeat protein